MAAPTALVSGKSGKGKKAPRTRVWFWADECKYEVVLGRARSLGWKLITDEKNEHNSNLFWIDVAAIHERFRTIQPWQVINHFPGMPNIARKNRMGQNLNRMLKLMPTEYNFYPRTWVLPGEMSDFEKNFDSQGNSSKIFIIKPDTGCQGKGIFLTKRLDAVPRTENVVAQVYLKKPMVIDDYKFDLRIYCYVSSVRPLRIYLFHDGLVRMCTEKYVKPTKQNLDQSCMHLTNYALNKSNSNYTKSNAQSSSDSSQQEDSHKRSLVWFMEWVRNTHGDAKADWLWRRIGILCVRTILSISPILSRDYLQYFKSFNNIPVDIEALQAQYNASKEAAKTGGNKDKDGSSTKKNTSESSKSTEKSNKTVEVSSQESGDEDDEEDLSNNGEENEESEEKNADTPAESDTNAEKTPKFRGSRAFEILGFDIMLDDKMKPWLIEVNHLPSFGTDSPLDLDIKKRLMEQVFATLPVRMDDDVAYSMFHQMESEKRLMKKREDPSVAEEKRAKEQQSTRSRSVERSSAPSRQRTEEPSPEQIAEEEKLLEERRDREAKEKELTIVAQQKASAALNTAAVAAAQALCSGVEMPHFMFTVTVDDFGETTIITSSIIDGEEHSQRLLEIIEILTGIYEEYCPEKISKIDRLLYKYQGREEEFLQFVVQKYSVNGAMLAGVIEKVLIKYHSITIPKISIKKAASEAEMEKKIAAAHSTKSSSARAPEKPKPWGSSARAGETRHSRSVSPPGAAGARQANWKGGNAEEEEAYREEIIATHVPTEEDEWMRFEMKHLTQFTRIFPALVTDAESKKEGRSDGKQLSEAEAAELEAKDEEEEEAEENGKAPMVSSSPKLKIASFVEIMVQVGVV